MKGNPEIIAMLNNRLAEEHSAVQQYSTHAAMCKNWGYKQLSSYLLKRAEEESVHANKIMDMILCLEGAPDFIGKMELNVGNDIVEIFLADKETEMNKIAGYTEGIELAVKHKDYATRCLMECILCEEVTHLGAIETNINLITQMGIENYLPLQV